MHLEATPQEGGGAPGGLLPAAFGKPGDCAVVGFSAHPDDFAVVVLATVGAGTKIFMTDRGVYGDGSLRRGEGVLSFTAPRQLEMGTVLRMADFSTSEQGHMALSSSGDQ